MPPPKSDANRVDLSSEADLAARRDLVKFDRETALEEFFFASGFFGLLAALGLFYIGKFGTRPNYHAHPALLAYIPVVVAFALLCFVAHHFTDNYYLVDPKQHLIYYHFKFLWFRSIRLLLTREDIVAVATRGRQKSNRSSTWWEYQVVVTGANGQVVPLSDWQRDALGRCNVEAEMLGQMLARPSYKSPPCCKLVIEATDGQVSLKFKRPPWWGSTLPLWAWVAIIAMVCFVMALQFWKH
jgi:hypothetical protein